MEKRYRCLSDIQSDILSNKLKLTELVEYYISRIKKYTQLNAIVESFDEEALQRAPLIEKKIKAGKAGKLAGMVVSIKDNICYKGHSSTIGSKILEGYVSPFSSTVVERMLAEDAIIIGRANCDEFAMGISNENSCYGPTLNMFDESKVPGGSSGGSAVSVQADMCLASLGTDTGGSVRQPAAFCGLIGLRPTYGRISRWGIIAYASSLDQVGTFSSSVEDAALLLEVMAGEDKRDSTCTKATLDVYSKPIEDKPKKIAYIDEISHYEGLDPEIEQHYKETCHNLEQQGHTIEAVSFPLLEYTVPTYYILTSAEASSNLARYDGIHYGHRTDNITSLTDLYKNSRSEGFGAEVKRRIMLGTFVLSAGYYDAFYSKAQKVRRLIQRATLEILNTYDFILTPTSPTTAFKLGYTEKDVAQNFLADIFTVQSPLSGIPSISLPTKYSKEGMPIGMQLMSKPYSERELLQTSKHIMNKQNLYA